MADAAILRVYTIVEWAKEVLAKQDEMRDGPPTTFADKVFAAQISQFVNQCDVDYERCVVARPMRLSLTQLA